MNIPIAPPLTPRGKRSFLAGIAGSAAALAFGASPLMAAPAVPSPPVSSGTPAQAIPADPAKPMRPGKVLANQVNSLSPSELQEAITSLKTHYFSEEVDEQHLL